MPKSEIEKQLEKNRLELKRQAEKDRREAQKQAHADAIRKQAASIVSVQEVIDGFYIIDRNSESVLKTLLGLCDNKDTGRVTFENIAFDPLLQSSLGLELEKLTQYGLLHVFTRWMSGGIVDLFPTAFTYFEDKEAALRKKNQKNGNTVENHFHGNTNVIAAEVSSSVIVAGDGNTVSFGEKSLQHSNEKQPDKNSLDRGIHNKVFISHRKLDEDIAVMLFDFLIATGIPREAVFCSSLPGNDVKELISKEVRQAIQTSQVNIAILSKNYYESAYCVNEAGVLWFLDTVRVIPITLPEITSDEMIGFLNKEYKPRHLDNSGDIAYIYDTITEILGIPRQTASVLDTESKKLIAKYTDYIANRGSLPISPAGKKTHQADLGITIVKFDTNNASDRNASTYQFDVIFCNQSERTLSVYEKYLHFYRGNEELKREEVTRYEVHRRKDDLDDLLVLEPVNGIITLASGHAEQAGIIRDYDDVKAADKVTFTCISEKQEYEVLVFSKEDSPESN